MAGDSAPDRFSDEVIVAQRYWYIWRNDSGDVRLVSPVMSLYTWPPMKRAEARCSDGHPAPAPTGCHCGFYALKDISGYAVPISGRDVKVAVGEVTLWGNIVEYEEGYRAQYAYPYSLEIHIAMRPTLDHIEHLATELSAVYGVEVVVKYPREHRRPRREASDRDHPGARANSGANAASGPEQSTAGADA